MSRWLREQAEMRDTQIDPDGTINETRFFRVSQETFDWLQEHGCLASISLCDWMDDTIISVAAFIEDWGSGPVWNGWNWIYDEFKNSGMNPDEFGI